MANVKISQLPSLSTLSGADEFPVVHSGTTYNITANAITAFATIDVPVANVSGIGNIATVNLNANASTVLAGDGTWVAQSGGSSTGDITFVNTTISAPAAEPISIQALDNDDLVGSQLLLDPDNTLTRLDGFSSQDSNSWTSADWATGVYTTQGGGTIGAVEFTGATAIIDYINSLPNPEYVFIQVNGGPLLPFAGSSGGATNITFYTNDLPATDPTTVTDFAYYYSLNSFIEMDYDSQELNIEGNGLDITISTRDNSDIEINSIRNLYVNGNGSYSLRNFSSNDPIQIQTDSNGGAQTWSFGANGVLSLPGEGVLQSTDDQVTLRSFDSGSGEANIVYLGTSGGLGFQDTSAGGNWLEIFRSGANPQIGTPGNLLITTDSTNTAPTWTYDNTGNLTLPGNTFAVNYANGDPVVIGSGGNSNTGNIYFNQSAILSNQSNAFVNLNDDVNGKLSLGTTSGSNVQIAVNDTANATGAIWIYDATGNLTLPSNASSINYANGAPYGGGASTYGNTNVNTYLNDGAFTGNFIPNGNATQSLGNITNQWLDLWVSNATIYLNAVPLGVAGNGVLQFNGNDIVTSGANVINTGNVETTGNVAGAYIIGDGSQLTNVTASTGDVTFDNTTVQGDNSSLNLSAGPTYTATLAYLQVRAGDVPSHIHLDTGDNATYDLLIGNDSKYVQVGAGGNVSIASDGGAQYIWNYDIDGSLKLATVNSESAQFVGTRKIVGGLSVTSPYSTALTGGTPTLAYTSTSGTSSAKITFAVQSGGSGFQWEQFDVVATPSQDVGGAVNFVVSNRVKGNSTIPDTVVTATMNGNLMEISLTLDTAQTSGGFASFDAVEFGLMVD